MGRVETMGRRVDSDLDILASSHHHTWPIGFADISGLSSILKTSPLFKLYAEYIIWNTGLNEAQVGIKTAGRNVNNLRYADDTTLVQKVKRN